MPPKKRTIDEAIEENGRDLVEEYREQLEGHIIDQNADQIRRKIPSFIESGAMKVGEFQQAIGVNSKSWSLFMGQSGPQKGMGSTVFEGAWIYFKARELKGLPMPKKPRATKAAAGKENAEGKDATGSKGKKEAEVPSVEGIELPGELEDNVAVFDSCDEVRRKISAHLKLPGVTQAGFLREVAKCYHLEARTFQSKQLNDFRNRRGAMSGNTSSIFYGAYVYFEKLRVKQDKPKSKHRTDMERVHGKKGMETKSLQNRMTLHESVGGWDYDSLGRAQIY